MYNCRECESEINQGTEICPQCGADLTGPGAGLEEPVAKPSLKKILLRWGLLLGILLAALWSFLWFVVPERRGNPTTQAESRALEAMSTVGGALSDYAASQNGTFPRLFESLDPKVREAAQLAQSVSYQIQYTPGPAEADGSIRSYVLQARAGNFSFRSFYMDESGVVRATRENRAATGQDPPI